MENPKGTRNPTRDVHLFFVPDPNHVPVADQVALLRKILHEFSHPSFLHRPVLHEEGEWLCISLKQDGAREVVSKIITQIQRVTTKSGEVGLLVHRWPQLEPKHQPVEVVIPNIAEAPFAAAQFLVHQDILELGPCKGVRFTPVPGTPYHRVHDEVPPVRFFQRKMPDGAAFCCMGGGGWGRTEGWELAAELRMAHRNHYRRENDQSGRPVMMAGDQIKLTIRAPFDTFAHVLLLKDTSLAAVIKNHECSEATFGLKQTLSVVLDNQPADERPLVLFTVEPLLVLEELVEITNTTRQTLLTADTRIAFLCHALKEAQASYMLLAGPLYRHVVVPSPVDHCLYHDAIAALQRDDYAAATRSLKNLLSRAQLSDERNDCPQGSLAVADADATPTQNTSADGIQPAPPESVTIRLNDSEAAYARLALGQSLHRQRNLAEARRVLQRVIDSRAVAADPRCLGKAYRELAWCALKAARAEEAIEYLERAEESHREARDVKELAYDLQARGVALRLKGVAAEALNVFAEALIPARQCGDHRLLGAILEGTGGAHFDLSDLETAEVWYRAALEEFKKAHYQRAEMRILGALGLIALDREEPRPALALFEKQCALVEKVGDPVQRAVAHSCLGDTLAQLGEARDALLMAELTTLAETASGYRAALHVWLVENAIRKRDWAQADKLLGRIAEQSGNLLLETKWRCALATATVRKAQKRLAEAAKAYQEGMSILEAAREALPPELRTSFLSVSALLYDGWIQYLDENAAQPFELLNAIERSRGRAMMDVLASVAEQKPDSDETRTAPHTFKWAEFSRAELEKVAFLVPYCLKDHIHIFAMHGTELVHKSSPVDREALRGWVEEALEWAASPPSGDQVAPCGALTELCNALLDPVSDWLKSLPEGTRLGVVPHGPLHGFSVHVIPLPAAVDEKTPPLVLRYPVFYEPFLHAASLIPERQYDLGKGVLALANPDGTLPFAVQESEAAIRHPGRGDLLRCGSATAEALERQGAKYRYIHLAAHADWDGPGQPAVVHLAEEASPRRVHDHSTFGSQTRGNNGKGCTGSIDAAWISGLSLYSTELVVISACLSGVGELSRAGEGPGLLPWAFLKAGVGACVAALWEVDDSATAELMEEFYKRLGDGVSKPEALAGAQRALLKSPREITVTDCAGGKTTIRRNYTHPYYWAGFCMTGDWR